MNGKIIYSAFRWCIYLNVKKWTLMTGFVVHGYISELYDHAHMQLWAVINVFLIKDHSIKLYLFIILIEQNKKKTEIVNILRENGSNHHQSTTGSAEIIEKMPTVTSAEQKRGKPDRGLKRGMKGKQVQLTESTDVKVAEIKSSDKADPINEPSAKRTTRPSRKTKEPPIAPCSTKESQSKPTVNGKTHALAESSGASSTSTAKDNRVQMQVKGQGCQASPKEKELDRRPKSNDQVRLIIHLKVKTISRKYNGGKVPLTYCCPCFVLFTGWGRWK